VSAEQSSEVLKHAYGDSIRAKRDYAMLAILFGCGLRRSELVSLELDEVQMRQGHWAVVDLIGKGGHIRTVPIPLWVKTALDLWTVAAGIKQGKIFRAVARTGKVWAVAFRKTLSGTSSKRSAKRLDWSISRRTTCEGPAPSCATATAARSSRFNSC